MSNAHDAQWDEKWIAWLAAVDRAGARGDLGTASTQHNGMPETLRPSFDDAIDCLAALRRVASTESSRRGSPPVPINRLSIEDAGTDAIRIGRFEVIREIGRGGFGIVYLANDPVLQREVALKLPRPEALLDEDLCRRLVREGQAAAALDHPNIVKTHEAAFSGPIVYVISDYCRGPSLAEWLKSRKDPVAARMAAEWTRALAWAIEHAHQKGILHRDIKPANILLKMDSSLIQAKSFPRPPAQEPEPVYIPLLTDFGLAKLAGRVTLETQQGTLLGTPEYMAPEQALGKFDELGAHSDVYSLGIVLYEILCGRPPFRGQTQLDTLRQVAEDEPVPIQRLRRGIPRDLESVCLKCLEKSPRKRYRSAALLAQDLARFLEGRPTLARPAGPVEQAWKWSLRNPTAAMLLLLLSLLPGAVFFGLHVLERRTTETRAQAQVQALFVADRTELPGAVRLVRELLPLQEPPLNDLVVDESAEPLHRYRSALVLADRRPAAADYLIRRVVDLPAFEIELLCRALAHAQACDTTAWQSLVQNRQEQGARRLRAACALAQLAPAADCWADVANDVAGLLISESAMEAANWSRLLQPVSRLLLPRLREFHDRLDLPVSQRATLAWILAEYLSDDIDALAELLQRSDDDAFASFFAKLAGDTGRARAVLQARLEQLTSGNTAANEADSVILQKARLAIGLFRLGQEKPLRSFVRLQPDPRLRYTCIHRMAGLGVEASELLQAALTEDDPSVQAAFLLALGDQLSKQITPEMRSKCIERMGRIVQTHPDSEVYSSAEWLLRKLRSTPPAEKEYLSLDEAAALGSYRHAIVQGFNFALILRRDEFLMGSPPSEPGRAADNSQRADDTETQQRFVIEPFAIATKETTLGQFRKFRAEHQKLATNQDLPVTDVTLEDVARFCNWLSAREKLSPSEFCFSFKPGKNGFDVIVEPDFALKRGYRIPTEAEWEYACRAGTTTARFFGESDLLMPGYGWFLPESNARLSAVGLLRPNPLGLFDIYGNVAEWTLRVRPNRWSPKTQIARGDHCQDPRMIARSAHRSLNLPQIDYPTLGFRLAKSLQPMSRSQ